MFKLPAYVENLRKEVRLLRIHNQQLQRSRIVKAGKISELDEEIKRLKRENRELEKERERLEKEQERLKREIEKLTKTNNRYQIALFDHGNFKHEEVGKKKKGGQIGHGNTNREKHEDYSSYENKRVFAKTCGKCGCALKRVKSTKQKILLDIVLNPEIVKLIIESERQWCRNCKMEVVAKDPQSLPFTEYGINTFMMVMILRFKSNASLTNIASVISIGYGLSLSQSNVSNLLKQAARFFGKKYEQLKESVRKGAVMYNDETGWLVNGQKAWMWIAASEKETVYIAAESRGAGIAKEIYGNSNSYCMTDGLASYIKAIPKDKHLYCWAHILRFAFEETVKLQQKHIACHIRDRLVDLYQRVRKYPELSGEEKEKILTEEIENLLKVNSNDQTVKNIQYRLNSQKKGLILALLVTEDGTNNLSERELRNMAIKRTVSNGSNTYKGMETTAIIGSIMQTLTRSRETSFIPALKTYLKEGIQEKYHQYIHIPYYDS